MSVHSVCKVCICRCCMATVIATVHVSVVLYVYSAQLRLPVSLGVGFDLPYGSQAVQRTDQGSPTFLARI